MADLRCVWHMGLSFGRFKTENRSLFLDAEIIAEFMDVVGRRIRRYDWGRGHSSLGNQAPVRYVKGLSEKESPQ